MAVLLKNLPQAGAPDESAPAPEPARMALGRRLHEDRCAGARVSTHGGDGPLCSAGRPPCRAARSGASGCG